MQDNHDWITDYFSHRWQAVPHDRGFPVESADALRSWQTAARVRLRQLLRLSGFTAPTPRYEVVCTERSDGYVREDILVWSEADYSVPVSVLRPAAEAFPGAAVIALHGHLGGARRAVIGDRSHPDVAQAIDTFNYDYGRQLALEGFTVYCPDSRGFGDRRSSRIQGSETSCNCREISNLAEALGLTLAGMFVWDISRLVDFIVAERGEGVRVSCVGFSGGGLQALYATAVDERISAAVVSGYFYGFRESLLELYGNCSCNYVPDFWRHFDAVDIAALIAPRRLFIETGDSDDLNGASGTRNVVSQVESAARAYRLLGAAPNLRHEIYPGPHQFYGTDSFEWLKSVAGSR